MPPLDITPGLVIDDAELEERFVRASGPGGQNVNKVASAVELRWDVQRSASLTDGIRDRLRRLAGSRMTADGILVVDARRYRTQAQNREDARERLIALVRKAAAPPRRRRKTRPTAASKERRLSEKTRRARAKQQRGRVNAED